MTNPIRYCGRDFTPDELTLVATLAATLATRRAIADAVCDALGWIRPDGQRKDMTARVALNRMAADGHITLPPPRNGNGNGRIPRHHTEASPQLLLDLDLNQPTGPAPATLDCLGPLHLALVNTTAASRQWRTLIATHHYLGYTPFAGAQLRYLVHSGHGIVAALGFAASAWKCAPRDTHIGWDPPTRQTNLHLIVGNARFLILPNCHIPNLASHLLARICRQLPTDWQATYGYTPVLVETFIETHRFTAASYRAANWIHVGQTTGRGKLDRTHQHALPVKDVYLYPLHRHYQRILTTPG
jgi:hypothetical protein